jgi:hypothetical protein
LAALGRKAIKVMLPKELEPFIVRLEKLLGRQRGDVLLITLLEYWKE